MHVTVNDKNNKETHHSQELKPLKSKNKSKNAKKNVESEEEIIFSIPSESNSDGEEVNLLWDNCTINFDHLQEYADTVSDLQCLRKKKTNLPESEKKKKKINWKRKEKSRSNYRNNVFLKVQRNLIESCENGDKETLLNSLSVYDNLPDGSSNEIEQEKKSSKLFVNSLYTYIHTLILL